MLNELQEKWCSESIWDFSDLKALFLNCTLKRSPEPSHTDGLIRISQAIMEKNGVSVDSLRPIDYDIATGVYPDMTEQGWEKDDWPQILHGYTVLFHNRLRNPDETVGVRSFRRSFQRAVKEQSLQVGKVPGTFRAPFFLQFV